MRYLYSKYFLINFKDHLPLPEYAHRHRKYYCSRQEMLRVGPQMTVVWGAKWPQNGNVSECDKTTVRQKKHYTLPGKKDLCLVFQFGLSSFLACRKSEYTKTHKYTQVDVEVLNKDSIVGCRHNREESACRKMRHGNCTGIFLCLWHLSFGQLQLAGCVTLWVWVLLWLSPYEEKRKLSEIV